VRVPSGTVTFLFTDIEDSSRLWDRHPIQMRVALERHDELLRSVIDATGGYVFTTAGDSFAAAFQTADAAARTALDIQTAVTKESWDADTPIKVRIGIHSGEAHERDGDYFGPAVNRAARIESAGHGRQILVSDVTARVLQASTTSEWRLTDLGEHHLKGLTEPEQIKQLDETEVAEFGPLNVAHTATTNLAGISPDLIGRDDDVDSLVGLLGGHQLVTVTGVGGVGKTSLAEAAAHRLTEVTSEVWFVRLGPLIDPRSVASKVAKVAGISGSPEDPDEIAIVLGRRDDVLVVLDNCEHVVDAVAQLVEALAVAPNVTVLATSRLELEVDGEQIVRLGPLGVNDPSAELFIRQARRRNPAFKPGSDDREVIEAICAQVDGIPLAIELAAAKSGSLDLPTILTRLTELLASTGRRQRGDPRHRTMTAAIDWSINLLDPDIAAGLGACTVFAGTFDLEAADAVIMTVTDTTPLEVVEELVAHSLIEPVRTDIGTRYRVLEPVRQRAHEELLDQPAQVQHAHLEHYLNRLEQTYDMFGTASCHPILDLINHDLDNLRAVHNWALKSGRIEDDLRLYRPLAFMFWHGLTEPNRWATETMALPAIESHPGWGAALVCSWIESLLQADQTQAAALRERSAHLAHDDPSADMLANTHAYWSAHVDGHWDIAVAQYERVNSSDTYVRFINYMFYGSTLLGATQSAGGNVDDAAQAIIERLQEGIDWSVGIGATNLEACLLQRQADLMMRARLRPGHIEVGILKTAEQMAEEIGGMYMTQTFASIGLVNASILGATIGESAAARLIRVLEESILRSNTFGAQGGLISASRILARHGEYELAALCALQEQSGDVAWLPPLALDEIPPDAWEHAEAALPRHSMYDVASQAIEALAQLPPETE